MLYDCSSPEPYVIGTTLSARMSVSPWRATGLGLAEIVKANEGAHRSFQAIPEHSEVNRLQRYLVRWFRIQYYNDL